MRLSQQLSRPWKLVRDYKCLFFCCNRHYLAGKDESDRKAKEESALFAKQEADRIAREDAEAEYRSREMHVFLHGRLFHNYYLSIIHMQQ
jgi:hypothetical protein